MATSAVRSGRGLSRVRQALVDPPGVPERSQLAVGGPTIIEVELVVQEGGVGARMRAGLRASNRRARHLPMRYETGLPSSVIRFRT